MRRFSDIEKELGLKKFLYSELGTLFYIPSSPGSSRVMVRFFDAQLKPEFIDSFVELLSACQNWVEEKTDLEKLVRVEQPIEVGLDFISRPHHTYSTSTDSYEDEFEPVDPPKELSVMRKVIRSYIGNAVNDNIGIIQRIMGRSLIEPSSKTYFDDDEMRFIVVEPKLKVTDIIDWKNQ